MPLLFLLLFLCLLSAANELSILGSHHAQEVDKAIDVIEEDKEIYKEGLIRGGDTIMNPSPNFFEDRPGAIWRQVGNGDVTYQSVDQKTIDARTFNRMRDYEEEITRDLRVGKVRQGEDARSIDATPNDIAKQLKGGRPI